MSLERFRRTRMVILTPRSTAYQAARAMADNHIGAILVSERGSLVGLVTDRDLALAVLGGGLDPKKTLLAEIMSEEVISCDVSRGLEEVVGLMKEHGIRRIPLVEGGRPVGLITFDDLVVDGEVSADELRAIVTAQLEVEAPQKPAGQLHPTIGRTAQSQARALMRAKARAEATYNRLLQQVAEATELDRDRAERALIIAACMLCRRLSPEEARDLIAQLPLLLQQQLEDCSKGPDRSVTAELIEEEVKRSMGLPDADIGAIVRGIFRVLSANVSAGQIAEVRGQLPEDMKALIPNPRA